MKSKDEFITKEQYAKYLRTYFAGFAMQGLMANEHYRATDKYPERVAIKCLEYTDELLKQLDNEGE